MPDRDLEPANSDSFKRAIAASDHPGYLGNPDVVAGRLREFGKAVLGIYDRVGDDFTPEQARDDVENLIDQEATIFAGEDPEHPGLAEWNDTGLGYHIRTKHAAALAGTPMPDTRTPIRQVFALFAADILRVPAMAGAGAEPAEIQDHVDTVLIGMSNTLLGIPDGD